MPASIGKRGGRGPYLVPPGLPKDGGLALAGRAWRANEDAYLRAAVTAQESAYVEAMGEWIRECGPWDYFVTLTFDPWEVPTRAVRPAFHGQTLPPTVSQWCAQRRFANFLRRAPKALGRQVEGVVAIELHKSGQPHGHGLLRVADGVKMGDKSRLAQDWHGLAGNGWIRLERPKSADDVAGYCSKYMTKDAGHLVISRGFEGVRHN